MLFVCQTFVFLHSHATYTIYILKIVWTFIVAAKFSGYARTPVNTFSLLVLDIWVVYGILLF